MERVDPEVGEVYEVKINDCCVEGKFTSKLISVNDHGDMTFENGVLLTNCFGCLFTEVEE